MRPEEDLDKIFFTSDLHLLHPKIVKIQDRPTTIEEHDEWLINRINSKVGKKDELYILGDVSMAPRIPTESLIDKMNGKKHLILGNHDNNIKTSNRFESISQIKDFIFKGKERIHIVLCHYPMRAWNRSHYGSYHLYGHVHGSLKPGIQSFDIGVDSNNYYPLSLREVLEKFKELNI